MSATITIYQLVLATHVTAIVAAFGILFAWPLLPGGAAAAHHARRGILSRLVSYAALLALAAGAYMASDASVWNALWVQVPLGVFVVLMGVVGGVLTPCERALALAATDGEQPDQERYAALKRRADMAAGLCGLLVVVAVVFMTAKPFT